MSSRMLVGPVDLQIRFRGLESHGIFYLGHGMSCTTTNTVQKFELVYSAYIQEAI